MAVWTREDTKLWISQLEGRISDIDFYLNKTVDWCEDRDIIDDRYVFLFSFMTCIWVCNMRGESITYNELLEILGLENMCVMDDRIYDLGDQFSNLDYDDLLEAVLKIM